MNLTDARTTRSAARGPEAHAESSDLARAVRDAIDRVLTEHQRHVAVTLLIDGVPIDVLAEHLGSNSARAIRGRAGLPLRRRAGLRRRTRRLIDHP